MITLWKSGVWAAGALLAAGMFTAVYADAARPGMVNYTEGNVTLNGRVVGSKAIGKTEVEPGQVLQTGQGKAEMLLVPGAYLRLGDNSAVEMVTPSLTDTRVELQKGQALVEVDQIQKENRLEVVTHGITTTLEKNGLYQFDADQPRVAVYAGEAAVLTDDRTIKVKKGRELPLVASVATEKPQSFDRHQTGPLYAWSKVRSEYEAEASQASAQNIYVNGSSWYGPGWYWNPWFDSWAFLPGTGFFYGAFGYPFYAPAYSFYRVPFYGGYYRGNPGHIRGGIVGGGGGVRGGFRTPAAHVGGFGGGHFGGGHFGGGHFGGGRR